MIEIDRENKTIVFYSSRKNGLKPLERKEFKLNLCYCCDSCDKIIICYFYTKGDDVIPWEYESPITGSYEKDRFRTKGESNYLHFSVPPKLRGMKSKDEYRHDHYCSRCQDVNPSINIQNNIRQKILDLNLKKSSNIYISSVDRIAMLESKFDFVKVFHDVAEKNEPMVSINIEDWDSKKEEKIDSLINFLGGQSDIPFSIGKIQSNIFKKA